MMPDRTLYFSAIIACLTAALFGYSVGFIGGLIVLPSFLYSFGLDILGKAELASAQSRVVTVWLVGALLGVPLGMPVCSRLGRKKCLGFSALLYVLGTVLQVASSKGGLHLFELGRFLNGLGVGAGTLVSPMYISEISPPAQRGMLMSGYQTVVQLSALAGFWGAFICNATFSDTSIWQWEIPVIVQLLPGALLLVGTLFIPETPRYLAEKGRFDAAEASLSRLRGHSPLHLDIFREMHEIRTSLTLTTSTTSSSKSFLSQAVQPSIRRRLFVGIGLMIAQNMVGLNALNYYSPVIFMSAGFTSVSSSLFLTGLFGVVKLISATSFMFVFVKVRGNRFWLKLGCIIMAICMFSLAALVRSLPTSGSGSATGVTSSGIFAVVLVYIFALAFGVSLGPISWNVCAEIFPSSINAQCCMVTTCTQWAFQIVIAGLTPWLLMRVGWGTYVVYGTCCIVSLAFCWVCVPETRGVRLGADMDKLFSDEDSAMAEEDDICEIVEVDSEITPLLRKERERRRSSVVVFT